MNLKAFCESMTAKVRASLASDPDWAKTGRKPDEVGFALAGDGSASLKIGQGRSGATIRLREATISLASPQRDTLRKVLVDLAIEAARMQNAIERKGAAREIVDAQLRERGLEIEPFTGKLVEIPTADPAEVGEPVAVSDADNEEVSA